MDQLIGSEDNRIDRSRKLFGYITTNEKFNINNMEFDCISKLDSLRK